MQIVTISVLCTHIFIAGAVLDGNRDTRWRFDPLRLTQTSCSSVCNQRNFSVCVSEGPVRSLHKWDKYKTERRIADASVCVQF